MQAGLIAARLHKIQHSSGRQNKKRVEPEYSRKFYD